MNKAENNNLKPRAVYCRRKYCRWGFYASSKTETLETKTLLMLEQNLAYSRGHSTEVALALHAQPTQVRITAPENFF